MTGHEIELDQHTDAGRQLTAVLSTALTAAQSAAQLAAVRARTQARAANEQAHAAGCASSRIARAAAQRARAAQALRHRQWSLVPSSRWLHDNPPSATSAWASADAHRGQDPVAARHADQWEMIFARENIDLTQVRANPRAAIATATGPRERTHSTPSARIHPAERGGDPATADVAGDAVLAGALDVAHADRQAAGRGPWTAYADGAPAAALGGRGVSTPLHHLLADARTAAAPAATSTAAPARATELAAQAGLER